MARDVGNDMSHVRPRMDRDQYEKGASVLQPQGTTSFDSLKELGVISILGSWM